MVLYRQGISLLHEKASYLLFPTLKGKNDVSNDKDAGTTMKKHIFLVIILVVIFGCAAGEINKPTVRGTISIPLPSSETRSRPVTWDGSPNLEPGLNPKDILLFEDFEDDHYHQRWKTHWGDAVGAGTVERPSQYVFAGKRSAYVENKKGYHDAFGSGQDVPEIPIDDAAYFRLYLRLQDGFSTGTTNQVKLMSIRGAVDLEKTYGGAGTKSDQKFSVDLCIDNSRDLHFYYYHPDQSRGWGDIAYCKTSFLRAASIAPGKWYCLELMLRNSLPGKKNGQLSAWLDDKLVGNVEKLRFRYTEESKIRRFAVVSYFGGENSWQTSPKDQRIYVDNLVVSRQPIGCKTPTYVPSPPAEKRASGLITAAAAGDLVQVRSLSAAKADVNAKTDDGETALMYAVWGDHAEAVNALLTSGADANTRNNNGITALIVASNMGNAEVVNALLRAGADANAKAPDSVTALMVAADRGRTEVVKALLAARVDVNAKNNNGETALMWASDRGHVDVVALLAAGTDMNAKANDGRTALVYASARGYAGVVNALLRAGADAKTKNNNGETALMYAVSDERDDHAEVVNALLTAGADANAKDKNGDTSLMMTSHKGHAKVVKALLDAGADVNAKNNNDETALMWAVWGDHAEVAEALLTAGADVNAKNNNDETALKIAQDEGHTGMVKLLRQAGGKE
jgi:ankyrin repeat protein